MKPLHIPIICFVTFLCGILFFSYYYEFILFNPPKVTTQQAKEMLRHEKKSVTIYFWHQDEWQKEDTEILWSNDQATSAQYLIRSWLNLLDEEKITSKKISLQSALLSPSGNELYISFDCNPLEKEAEIYKKLMFVEGLLKTLKNNDLEFSFINLLVHHQPINDNHLDFNQSWPCQGFISQ